MQEITKTYSVPGVRCQLGGERIVLPYQTLAGTTQPQHYWPTDKALLVLVCQDHGHTSFYSNEEVEWFHTDGLYQPSGVFWKVLFGCDRAGCERTALAHARVEVHYTSDDVATLVISSRPGIQCVDNHVLTPKAKVLSSGHVHMGGSE